MATYYVATTGNDTTGDGSSGNKWATISKALSSVSLGDTISVAVGTYSLVQWTGDSYTGSMDTELAVPNWINITAESAGVIISSASASTYAMQLGDYSASGNNYKLETKFSGIKFVGEVRLYNSFASWFYNCEFTGYGSTIQTTNSKLLSSNYSCDTTIENCDVHFGSINGLDMGQSNYLYVIDTDIYDIGSDQIRMSGTTHLELDGSTIRGTNWWDTSSHPDGFQIYNTGNNIGDIIVKNCIFKDLSAQGFYINGPIGINSITMENNLFGTNSKTVIIGTPVKTLTLTNNTFTSGFVLYGGITTSYEAHNNIFINLCVIGSTSSSGTLPPSTSASENIYWNKYKAGTQKFLSDYDTNPINTRYQSGTWDITLAQSILDIFTNTPTSDFTLKASAEVVNVGNAVTYTATDILGATRDAWPDLGCYEYGVVPIVVPEDPEDPDYPVDPPIVPDDPIETTTTRTARFYAHFVDSSITADVSGTITWSSGTEPEVQLQ